MRRSSRLPRSFVPMLAAGFVAVGAGEVAACSGPGAARAMRVSGQIGLAFAGGSLALVLAGRWWLARRGQPGRARAILLALGLQLVLGMGTTHGDCGYALRVWSGVAFLLTALVVALALAWPGRGPAGPWRWRLGGGLAGLLLGLPVVAVDLGSSLAPSPVLAGLALASLVAAGGLVGEWRRRGREAGRPARSFGLRTLLLGPVLLAPILALLLPARPYEMSVSVSRPFHFVAVDAATGRPVPGATVRMVDPAFAELDPHEQYPPVITGPDGRAESFFTAREYGRAGLLGRTETTTYHPLFVRAEAPSYRPFAAALAGDPPANRPDLTDAPLGLTFPPPPSATLRLRPVAPPR